MADEFDPGNDAAPAGDGATAETPAAEDGGTGGKASAPAEGQRWGVVLLGLAVVAVVLTLVGVFYQAQDQPNHLPLGVGLFLWGCLDLFAQARGLVVWKGPKAVVGNVVNLLRGLALLGLGVWLGLMATGLVRPVNPAVITWLGISLVTGYLAVALGLEVIVKGLRLSAQPFLLAALLAMLVSYYYFAIPFTFSWAAVFALLSFVAAAWSVQSGVLEESPALSKAVLLAVLLLATPLGTYSFQQAFLVEEQPLFTPTLLIPRMRQVLGGLSEDAEQIRWSPVHTQPGQPGDVPFSDKVAFVDWDKDQELVKLFQQHEDGMREILRVDTGTETELTSFSEDGGRLAYTQVGEGKKHPDLNVLEPEPSGKASLPKLQPADAAAPTPVPPRNASERHAQALAAARQASATAMAQEKETAKLAELPYRFRHLYGHPVEPGPEHGQVWRDQGRQLYFAAPPGGPRNPASAVLRADLNDGSVRTLREGRGLPAVSPDGKYLLSVGFAANERFLQIADGHSEERHPRAFVPAHELALLPAWNASQTKVLFWDAKSRRLMIMNSNGKNHQVFTPALLDSKDWMSDKQVPFTLAFKDSGDRFRVYRSLADGSREKLIYEARGHDLSAPQWSSDGQRVAFIVHGVEKGKASEVVTVGSDGSWPRHFFTTADDLDELKWSPDSGKLAWICRRMDDGTQEIWTAGFDGLDPERVHVDTGELKDLSWSPAGKHLAVQQTKAWKLFGLRLVKPDLHDVLMVDLVDLHARVMTRYGIMSRSPSFSPQGVAIAYFTDQRPWNWNPQPLRDRTSALVISQLY